MADNRESPGFSRGGAIKIQRIATSSPGFSEGGAGVAFATIAGIAEASIATINGAPVDSSSKEYQRLNATPSAPVKAEDTSAKVELAGLRGELRAAMGFVLSYIEEARGALDETYRFASTSPRAQQNINAAFEMLEEIEKQAKPYTSDAQTDLASATQARKDEA